MLTTILAYVLLVLFFVIERGARVGAEAKSLERKDSDRDSTTWLSLAFLLASLSVLAAPVLNDFQLGRLPASTWIGWMGIGIACLGIALRFWANRTLGAFYTRTLRIVEHQPVVQAGPYKLVRHPGYLGVNLMWGGAALATTNWIAIVLTVTVLLAAYHYRIQSEEKMLLTALGPAYKAYRSRTWRLVPFLY